MGILRLLLALSVVAAHSGSILGSYIVGGEIAVKTFFIISGFYMSLILNEKYIGGNSSYKLFIGNRFLRLYPVYWTVLLLTIVLCAGIGFMQGADYGPVIEQYLGVHKGFVWILYLGLSNLFIFGLDAVMFLGLNAQDGSLYFTSDFAQSSPQLFRFLFIPQAWTLGLELMFYLIAPFVLKRGFKIVLFLLFLSVSIRLFIHFILELQDDPWTYRFFPSELMFFLLGYISYRLYLKLKVIKIPDGLSIGLFVYLIILSVVYLMIPTFGYPDVIKEYIYYGSILLILPLLFKFFKHYKFDRLIGELSYPVYISHVMVIMFIEVLVPGLHKHGLFVSFWTIGVSIALNYFIANPIEKFRQSRVKSV